MEQKTKEKCKDLRIKRPTATLQDIAKEVVVSRERVRQILKKEGLETSATSNNELINYNRQMFLKQGMRKILEGGEPVINLLVSLQMTPSECLDYLLQRSPKYFKEFSLYVGLTEDEIKQAKRDCKDSGMPYDVLCLEMIQHWARTTPAFLRWFVFKMALAESGRDYQLVVSPDVFATGQI